MFGPIRRRYKVTSSKVGPYQSSLPKTIYLYFLPSPTSKTECGLCILVYEIAWCTGLGS